MVRPLTAAMASEIQNAKTRPILLVEFDFPSWRLRLTNHTAAVAFANNSYLADGTLLGVSAIEETTALRAAGTRFTLAATAALRATVLTDYFQGRRAAAWLGLIDSSAALVADPEPLIGGIMEAVTIDDDADAPVITINVENRLRDLNLPNERRWSNEDQAAEFPGDGGFRYVEAIQDFELLAGRV